MSKNYFHSLINIITNQHYNKQNDFSLFIINFQYLRTNIPILPAYNVYTSKLTRYTQAYCFSFHDALPHSMMPYLFPRCLTSSHDVLTPLPKMSNLFPWCLTSSHDVLPLPTMPYLFPRCPNTSSLDALSLSTMSYLFPRSPNTSSHDAWSYSLMLYIWHITSFTLTFFFAEVSMNSQLKCRANPIPWSFPTTRSSSKSHLFPTRIMGTCQHRKTKKISNRK